MFYILYVYIARLQILLKHSFLIRLQIYCKKRNKALVYVPKTLFHVPVLFQSPQKSIFKTLYLQALPEIAVSAVVWIDNHLLQDNLWVYHHDTNRMLASLDSGRRSGN